jgi:hypothetical protein
LRAVEEAIFRVGVGEVWVRRIADHITPRVAYHVT